MNTENPCLACSTDQDCCTNLVGLRLSKTEYDLCFAHHAESGQVTVGREGPIYIINPDEKRKCPNWDCGGCSVYENRPLECRLFPHTLYVKKMTTTGAEVRWHAVPSCPLVRQLRMTEKAVESAAHEFCADAFGTQIQVSVRAESLPEKFRRKSGMFREKITRRLHRLIKG